MSPLTHSWSTNQNQFDPEGGAPLESESLIMIEHKQPEGEHKQHQVNHQPLVMNAPGGPATVAGGIGEAADVSPAAAAPHEVAALLPGRVEAPMNAPVVNDVNGGDNVAPQPQLQPDQVVKKGVVPILRELGQALLDHLSVYLKWLIYQLYSIFGFVNVHRMAIGILLVGVLLGVVLAYLHDGVAQSKVSTHQLNQSLTNKSIEWQNTTSSLEHSISHKYIEITDDIQQFKSWNEILRAFTHAEMEELRSQLDESRKTIDQLVSFVYDTAISLSHLLSIPPRPNITDYGYMEQPHGYCDALGRGYENDYFRYVGQDRTSHFCVTIAGSNIQCTDKGVFEFKGGKVVPGPKYDTMKVIFDQLKANSTIQPLKTQLDSLRSFANSIVQESTTKVDLFRPTTQHNSNTPLQSIIVPESRKTQLSCRSNQTISVVNSVMSITGQFDESGYLDLHPGIRGFLNMSGWDCYKKFGHQRNHQIQLVGGAIGTWDENGYLLLHRDVKKSGWTGWRHYSEYGKNRNRLISIYPTKAVFSQHLNDSTNCSVPINQIVKGLCDGQSSCFVSTTKNIVPQLDDSCVGKEKRLLIQYQCVDTPSTDHLHLSQVDVNTTLIEPIKPRQFIVDEGRRNKLRGWFDVQGQGVENDYCRYVALQFNEKYDYFSCALAGTHNEYTAPGVVIEKSSEVMRGPWWTEKLGLA